MATGIIDTVKRAAMEAMENDKPTDLRYGKVVSVSPLKVQVTNQFNIPSSMLVVPQHLTNYEVSVTLDEDRKKMTIHNALQVNDKVALIRQKGGQSYLILDRV